MWHDFCDWYVEFVKNRVMESSDVHLKRAILNRAIGMYEETLKLLHPLMPFVTEEIWQHLSERASGESIMTSAWPLHDEPSINMAKEKEMEFLQSIISAVRAVRSEMNLPPSKEVDLVVNCHDTEKVNILEANRPSLERMAKLQSLSFGMNMQKPGFSASSVVQGQELFIPLEGLIDIGVERARLEKEISRLEGQLNSVRAKLENPNFAGKAPADVIEKEKDKQKNFQETINKLKTSLEQLTH
jgi:valyl-tRNA synthetase